MTDEELVEMAMAVRKNAYSPYSCFQVGAALVAFDGEIFTGCNVENISFGLTMCAERVAVGVAVRKGATNFEVLALAADSAEPVAPCGACRQVLAEFSPNLRIVSSTLTGNQAEWNLSSLLPSARQGILD
jgi:cytidine deaminase